MKLPNHHWLTTNSHNPTGSNIRARVYGPAIGRWLSKDPLAIVNVSQSYEYVANDVVNGVDPSGLLTIQPRSRKLGKIPCGTEARMSWDFYLDTPTQPGHRRKGAPCDGYFVQHVTVYCLVSPCDDCLDLEKVTSHDYWEAWPVRRGQRKSLLRRRNTDATDTARFTARQKSCGYYVQLGEVRFYCASVTGNLASPTSGWHNPRKWGVKHYASTPEFRTTPSLLLSIGTQPRFWRSKAVDGPSYRSFALDWQCCKCPGVNIGGSATASPVSQ